MRILYASERPPFPFFLGGAARSAHYVLSALARDLGSVCTALGSADFTGAPWQYPAPADYAALGIKDVKRTGHSLSVDCGYTVTVSNDFSRALLTAIDTFSPDLLWAQLDGAATVLEIGQQKGVRALYFMRDAELKPAEMASIAATGAHIVCNSSFLARRVEEVTGRKASFVYPSLDALLEVTGDRAGYLTMINPHRVKGIDTFLEIARTLPDLNFMLVESWQLDEAALAALAARLKDLPNVLFQRRVADMRPIYGKTRLLLVPSVWEEAFGRVAIEAQSCGIPVIASARGGLPESVGEGGILIRHYRDPQAWVNAIKRVLSEQNLYDALANRALRHARSDMFTPSYAAHRFYEICSETLRQESTQSRSTGRIFERLRRVPLLGTLLKPRGR